MQESLCDQFVDVATEYVVSRGYTVHTMSLVKLSNVRLTDHKIILVAMLNKQNRYHLFGYHFQIQVKSFFLYLEHELPYNSDLYTFRMLQKLMGQCNYDISSANTGCMLTSCSLESLENN